MASASATATEDGYVLLTFTQDDGKQTQYELSIELADWLKSQIEAALDSVRGEHERLRYAHNRELVLRVPDRVGDAAGFNHAYAKQFFRDAGQGRVNLGVFPVAIRLVAPMRFRNQGGNGFRVRQMTG